jgi:hypothetical protein
MDAPRRSDFSKGGRFSLMRFGGSFPDALGYSDISYHHAERVDDATPERGVATASLLAAFAGIPELNEPLLPIHPEAGTAVGEHPQDALILRPGFDPYAADDAAWARYQVLARAARLIGMGIASVTAHEMGHGLGLVPDGPPPQGFFAGEADVTFMGPSTNSHHADYPGLNLMQAGGDLLKLWSTALEEVEIEGPASLAETAQVLAEETRLSAYSRAYLAGRLTYR